MLTNESILFHLGSNYWNVINEEEGGVGRASEKDEEKASGGETRKDGWKKVLYGEYGAAVRRVFIAAAICRPIVITALSNPSYDCMCHAGSMLPPRLVTNAYPPFFRCR